MPPWLESHADLRDHPKLDLLMELLGITRRDAVGLLHFVWWRTLTYAPSGDLSDFTDGQVARWAEWEGEPGQLVSALKTAGFMDAQRMVHDWDEYAGRWIDRRNADAARKRDARKVAAHRANGMSGGHPPGRRPESGVPDLTGPDHTGPDVPPNPPQAGGRTRARSKLPIGSPRGSADPRGIPIAEPTSSLTPEEIEEWKHRYDPPTTTISPSDSAP